MEAFGIVVMLSVFTAAWVAEHAGLSMTLGAFLMGMVVSASDYRYQVEVTVAPFKDSLMGLFFIAVGMSVDISTLLSDWSTLVAHIPALLFLKVTVLIGLILAFGIGRQAAVRSGFLMSQFGEFAFVLFGAAAVAGVLSTHQLTLGMLAVALSMTLTPLMVKVGGRLAARLGAVSVVNEAKPAAVTLQCLYPSLEVYVRVRTLKDQDELVAKGIKHAGTGYIESTLVRGSMLLKGIGIPEADVQELIKDFQRDDYTLIRTAYVKPNREQ